MHKVLFPIFFLVLFCGSLKSSPLVGQSYIGYFACQVTKISVMQVKEGIPKIYKSLEGRHKEGDVFGIKYSFNDLFKNELYFSNLRKEDGAKFFILNFGEFKKPKFENTTGMMIAFSGEEIASAVSSEKISIYNASGDIFLERYYKNDWHGIMTKVHNNSTHETLAIDCVHKQDQLDEIIEEAKERLKNQ